MKVFDKKTGHPLQLVYSPDDEVKTGKGWYWQDLVTWKTSQLYKYQSVAVNAHYRHQSMKWC